MKAFFTMNMVLEMRDLAELEEWRTDIEKGGWDGLIGALRAGLGEEPTEEFVDEHVLFYGVHAWPLPFHP